MSATDSVRPRAPGPRRLRSSLLVFAVLVVSSFLAGILLAAITALVARAGLEGQGWSLRGNGALIVPACGLPIILVVGCALLSRRLNAGWPSCLLGSVAGIVALGVSAILAAILSPVLFPLLLLVALGLALLIAWLGRGQSAAGWLMAASLAIPISAYAGIRVWSVFFSSP